jgi:hypothetical protein
VESIKAGNPLYAIMLKYFLWMAKLPDGARWGILIGGYLGSRLLAGVARANPDLAPWVLPLRVLYVVFALLTWLAQPLFNLMLFVHPMGRHALDRDQRAQASWVGCCLVLGLGTLALWLIANRDLNYLIAALVFGLLTLPVSAVYLCEEGWPRRAMAGIALGLAAVGLFWTVVVCLVQPLPGSPLEGLAGGALGLFFIGVFLSQWVANWLATQRPRR